MKLGIVGSRRRSSLSDKNLILDYVQEQLILFSDQLSIISGGCSSGADLFAEEICSSLGLSITIHYPNKFLLDARAQKHEYVALLFKRNEKIAIDCDILLALPTKDRTGGTENTIKHAERLGKKVVLL